MGEIVPFGSDVQEDETSPQPTWWQRCSRTLAWVVLLLAFGWGTFTSGVLVLGLACGGAFLSMGTDAVYLGRAPDLLGVVPFASLPAPTRAAYTVTLIIDTAPLLFSLAELYALLRLFGAGYAFGPKHGAKIRRIAAGLCAAALAPALGRVLVLLAGHGVDTAWFHVSTVEALLLAAALWLAAAVMDAGHAAEEDGRGFI